MHISLQDLVFGYSDPVGSFNGTVRSGSVTVVAGPNGSGKSTFISTLAGELAPLDGTMIVDADGQTSPVDSKVITRIADPVFYPELTVRDHLNMLEKVYGSVADDLAQWEVEPLLDSLPGSLSSGQRQRCYLAIHLPFVRKFVAFDEPERHLDAEWQGFVKEQLIGLAEAGHGVLLATHSAELKAIADQTIDVSAHSVQ